MAMLAESHRLQSTTLELGSPMAIQAEPDMAKRNDVPVKMDAEVVRKAKVVAAYRGQSLAEFLSAEIASIVDRLLEAEHAKMVKGSKPKAKGEK